MKIHVVILLTIFGSCSLEKDDVESLVHHLTRRQAAEHGYAPMPYQQRQADSSSSASASSAGGNGNGGVHGYGQGDPIDDWLSSSHLDHSSSSHSQGGGEGGGGSSRVYHSPQSGSESRGRRPYYQYQPPTSSGRRQASGRSQLHVSSQSLGSSSSSQPHRSSSSSSSSHSQPQRSSSRSQSHGASRSQSHGASRSQSSQSQHQGSSSHSSNSQGNVPTQTHTAGVTRYTYSGRQPVSGSSSRRQGSRTYSYPFSGGRASASHVAILGSQEGGADGEAGAGGDNGEADVASRGAGAAAAAAAAAAARRGGGGGGGRSLTGDEEPVVQVFPSERPVVNPQASREERIRQREMERRRRLQQRLRQQQQQQQQQQQTGAGGTPQSRPTSSGRQRQVYTGSQQLGIYGQPTQQYVGQRQRQRYGGQPTSYGGQPIPYGGQIQSVYNGQIQPIYGGLGQPVYGGQGQPVYRGQVQPVYGGVNRQQQPYLSRGYNLPDQQAGYDSECPNTGIRIQINGIPCEQAVDHYGSYLCYRHEYTSRECCLKCQTLKNPARVGCEYGDHSGRCSELQPYDCYDLRNRQSCCQSCERMRIAGARTGCEYGDMTPNCERVRQNPGLCYIPENRYLCCSTCSTIRVTEDPECPWGDFNGELCQPFDQEGNIRINCYVPSIKRLCCQACTRLEEWIPMDQPGCEYGDRPVTFNTGAHRNLNCTSFMRYYGYEQCSLNQDVATHCCYTCHRYSQG